MKTHTKIVLSSIATLAYTAGIHAATIVSYDFNTNDLPTSELLNTNSSVMTGEGWTSGSSASFGRSSSSNSYFGRGPSINAATSWVGFTINADSGYELDLDQLTFNYTSTLNLGTFTFEVRSSIDGYANAISGTYTNNPLTTKNTTETASFDLTGGTYDNLDTISFRLYATKSVGTSSSFNDIVRWDNISVTGDAPLVPEPSSLALLGLGGLCMMKRRRRA